MGTQLLEHYSKTSYMGSWRLFDIDFNITSKKITKTNLFNIFFFLISNYLVYETTIQHVFPIHSDRERNQYIFLNDQYIHTYVTLYMIILPSMRKSTVWFQLNLTHFPSRNKCLSSNSFLRKQFDDCRKKISTNRDHFSQLYQ